MLLRATRAGFILKTKSLKTEQVNAGAFLFSIDDIDERVALAQVQLAKALLATQRSGIAKGPHDSHLQVLDDEIALRKAAMAYAQHHLDWVTGGARIGADVAINVAEAKALLASAARDSALAEYQKQVWLDRVTNLDRMLLAATAQLDLREQRIVRDQARCVVMAPISGRSKWYAFAGGFIGLGDPIVELTP